MPSVAKSPMWFIRVTASHEQLRQHLGRIAEWIDTVRVLGVLHIGSKTSKEHCHLVLELSSVLQKQSMVTRIKKLIQVEGNQSLSVKEWDGNETACQYLFASRSKPEVFISKGFTQEQLDTYVASASTVDAEWDASHPLGLSQRGNSHTVTNNTIINELAEYIKTMEDCSGQKYWMRVGKKAIDIHNKYERPFCVYSLQKIVETAISRSSKSGRKCIAALFAEKYIRNSNLYFS